MKKACLTRWRGFVAAINTKIDFRHEPEIFYMKSGVSTYMKEITHQLVFVSFYCFKTKQLS